MDSDWVKAIGIIIIVLVIAVPPWIVGDVDRKGTTSKDHIGDVRTIAELGDTSFIPNEIELRAGQPERSPGHSIVEEELMNRCITCGKLVTRSKAQSLVKYDGHEYLVCCPLCEREFGRDPEYYIAVLRAALGDCAVTGHSQTPHAGASTRSTATYEVGVACTPPTALWSRNRCA